MVIKDNALNPFYILSDYHGLHLFEQTGSKETKLGTVAHNELGKLLGEVARRKLAAMPETVTLKEYTQRETALYGTLVSAVEKPATYNDPVAEESVAVSETIS